MYICMYVCMYALKIGKWALAVEHVYVCEQQIKIDDPNKPPLMSFVCMHDMLVMKSEGACTMYVCRYVGRSSGRIRASQNCSSLSSPIQRTSFLLCLLACLLACLILIQPPVRSSVCE